MSLRTRLALWWGGLTGLVVLSVGLLGYAAEVLTLYNDLDEALKAAAVQIADQWDVRDPAPELSRILAESRAPGLSLRAYDPGGALLAEAPATTLAPPLDPRAVLAVPGTPAYDPLVQYAPPYVAVEPGEGAFGLMAGAHGDRWRVYVLPVHGDPVGGGVALYVLAAAPLHDVDRAVDTLRRLVPLLAGAGAAAMLVAGALLATRLLRPVAVLTATAGAIARARDFAQRVPAGGRRDELGQMAVTFNDVLANLEQAYRTQQRFVADASHELRTPLTAIQANLDLLARRGDMPPSERHEALEEARREARRLVRLVADLLSLARADAGLRLPRRRVELEEVLMDVFTQSRLLADGRDLAVAHLEPVMVHGDPDRLKELLLILLDNALKYTPAGGRVTLELRGRDGVAEVVVRDTGIGVPPDDLPHIFERFYRAELARARDPAGTGLGLSIASWIAQQHGGDIRLESAPQGGTTVTVRLPAIGPARSPLWPD